MALYQDLWSFRPTMVWKNGALVAKDGECLIDPKQAFKKSAQAVRNSVKLTDPLKDDLVVKGKGEVRVIGVRPQEIETDYLITTLPVKSGHLESDPERDIVKLAVYDRYHPGAKPALGFIKGLGLKKGAISSTVSHDSHNLVIAGTSDEDMALCARRTIQLEGGLVVALSGKVLCDMALPLGGLMSLKTLKETANEINALNAVLPKLGFPKGADPFMTLAFMSLPVIPKLKLTAAGLVDVNRFQVVPLFV
jgi:adenine deaminase